MATCLLVLPVCALAENRALLIGINDYLANDAGAAQTAGQTWIPEDLNGAVNDIALMKQILVTRFGFDERNITVLLDADATRENMLRAMHEFAESTRPGDVAYFHFSGHGSQVDDASGDEADDLDETILPHDARTGNVADITDDELQVIFDRLQSASSLVVLDSCHSGTATRGFSSLKSRSVPLDPRGNLYEKAGAPAPNSGRGANYVLMTGAADYQSALDGPLDNGRYYGLFTWSLAQSLGRAPAGASAREIHDGARKVMQEIGTKFGLWAVPESQLEATEALKSEALLTEAAGGLRDRAVARLPYADIVVVSDTEIRLQNAALLGAAPGSYWALYGPGETEFRPGRHIGKTSVTGLVGNDAAANVDSARGLAGGRAVQLLASTSPRRVAFRFDTMPREMRARIEAALRLYTTIQIVDEGEFARYVVDLAGDHFAVRGAGGIQLVDEFWTRDPGEAARKLAVIAERSESVDSLLDLNNTASKLRVRVEVKPEDQFGGVRGVQVVGASDAKAYRIRERGESRNRSNSLMLEIEVSEDAYVTVVDIDPEGSIGVLFPNSISDRRNFYRDGLIKAGKPVSIPDALVDNSAGFYWDFAAPAGIDTIRVFAARDLSTARAIRQYIAEIAANVNTRGIRIDREDLFATAARLGTRGVQTVAAEDEAESGDWAAATEIFVVED